MIKIDENFRFEDYFDKEITLEEWDILQNYAYSHNIKTSIEIQHTGLSNGNKSRYIMRKPENIEIDFDSLIPVTSMKNEDV